MSEEEKLQLPIKPNYFNKLSLTEIGSWVITIFQGNLDPIGFSQLPESDVLLIDKEMQTYHKSKKLLGIYK